MQVVYKIEAEIDETLEISLENNAVWIYQGGERIRFSPDKIEEVIRALEIIDNALSVPGLYRIGRS